MTTEAILIMAENRVLGDTVEKLLRNGGMSPLRCSRQATHVPPGALRCILTDSAPQGLGELRESRVWQSARNLPIVVLVPQGDVKKAVQAIKLGASEVVETTFDEERFLENLCNALTFGTRAGRSMAAPGSVSESMQSLTRREYQVLEHLISGKSNKEMARELSISARTVEVHRAHVMFKMRARNVAQLLRMVVGNGRLLDDGGDLPHGNIPQAPKYLKHAGMASTGAAA